MATYSEFDQRTKCGWRQKLRQFSFWLVIILLDLGQLKPCSKLRGMRLTKATTGQLGLDTLGFLPKLHILLCTLLHLVKSFQLCKLSGYRYSKDKQR